jgi:hypothetical protein
MPERRPIGGVFVEFQPMSPEEIQRTVQFLLHQQAQFAVDCAASQARFDARIEKLSAKTDQVADGLIGLTAIVGHVVDGVSQIADAQKRTESHLNVVIQMFERHLREDHGHRPS